MLFNSYAFLFGFLPLTLALVLGLSALGHRMWAKLALAGASLVFYGWWSPKLVLMLLAMLAFNYIVGTLLLRTQDDPTKAAARKALVTFGIVANLATLGYFKYAMFAVSIVAAITGRPFAIADVILPLGLSFIVFQKIAFLVDIYTGAVTGFSFIDYCLFVTFFPQLIAGPIVHHREVIPQFESDKTLRFSPQHLAAGASVLAIGLFKKVAIADAVAPIANSLWLSETQGQHLGVLTSWLGTSAYTLQLYFDFSGYSDMAIGLGLLFGIRLPLNFASPLRAPNMIEFWRRWHMSLTRFLTAYIYNPVSLRITRARLAKGKKSAVRGKMTLGGFAWQLAWPTFLTMFLSGIWHGAGYTFIIFGAIQGVLLVVTHGWQTLRKRWKAPPPSAVGMALSRTATFLAWTLSLILFRAPSVHDAVVMFRALFGGASGGVGAAATSAAQLSTLALLAGVLAFTQFAPNTQEVMGSFMDGAASTTERADVTLPEGSDARPWSWAPTARWGVLLGLMAWYVVLRLFVQSPFLYFQF